MRAEDFLRAVDPARASPAPDGGALAHAPWLGWLAVCLCRQRARQAWLCEIARSRLERRADGEEEGDVPAMAGWSYEFHGMGLRLDGPERESIDYDFHDREGRAIDPWFFAGRVMRLARPGLPEARLRRWLLVGAGIVECLPQLRALGAIVDHESETARGHVFQLGPALAAMAPEVAAMDFTDPAVRDDFARTFADVELFDAPAEAREAVETTYTAQLEAWATDRSKARRLLGPVTQALRADDAARVCLSLLEGPIDSTTGEAIEALGRLGVDATGEVRAVLARLAPEQHHPYPAWAAASYLLERGAAHDAALAVVEAFAAVDVVTGFRGNPFADKLAMLVLEHAPERALPWVRRALRSTTPSVVEHVAALLAVLGHAWCHRELESALREPRGDDDRGARAARRYLAAALAYSDSELAQRRGAELAPGAPERAPGALGFTFDEVLAKSMDRIFPEAMERVMPLAQKLLERQPPISL